MPAFIRRLPVLLQFHGAGEPRLTELGSVIIARRLSGEGEFDEIVADHDGVELQAFGLVDRSNYEV